MPTLYLIRHADCAPGDDDKARPLNDHGLEQAFLRGDTLRDVKFYRGFTSPAQRAVETMDAILDSKVPRSVIEELYTLPTAYEEMLFNECFKKLGRVTLANYIEELGSAFFKDYADAVRDQMYPLLPGEKYLIAGHAVLLNALALSFLANCRYEPGTERLILDTVPRETEGFKITFTFIYESQTRVGVDLIR